LVNLPYANKDPPVTPPPIRYPLPTLVAAAIFGVVAWKGEALSRPWRASLATRWERAVEGPAFPHSDAPMTIAGPLVRRVLLMQDDVPSAETPGGAAAEMIRHRMIADVYDVWPLSGTPTHYRIGNRRPLGWVAAGAVLTWDTRLVAMAARRRLAMAAAPGGSVEVGEISTPIVEWRPGAVRVATWERGRPWSEVSKIEWVKDSDLPASAWGAFLSRDELLTLLRRSLSGEDPKVLRLRAILGRLGDERPLSATDYEAARGALPSAAFSGTGESAGKASEALARINEEWTPDASWAGLAFRAVPVEALP